MFRALATLAYRAPKRVLLGTLVILAAAVVVGFPVFGMLETGAESFEDPASESVRADKRLARAAGAESTPGVIALVRSDERIASVRADERLRRLGRRAQRLGRGARREGTRARRLGRRAERAGAAVARGAQRLGRSARQAETRAHRLGGEAQRADAAAQRAQRLGRSARQAGTQLAQRAGAAAAERAQRLERSARQAGTRARRLGQRAQRVGASAASSPIARRAQRAAARAARLGDRARRAGRAAERAEDRSEEARSNRTERRIERIEETLEDDPAVDRAVTYYEAPVEDFLSRDRRSTYIPVFLKPGADDAAAERIEGELADEPGLLLGGAALTGPALGEQVGEDIGRAEAIAFPILFLLSLFVFRGFTAALLPLFVGATTVFGTLLGLRAVSEFQTLSIFCVNLVIGLGLGLAIDYSLFVVSRYREELERSGVGLEALQRTMQTAGKTVLFSAATVAVALSALLVFPQQFLFSMGYGGAICALVAALTSLVALPALLALLGERVNEVLPGPLGRLVPRGMRDSARRAARQEGRGFWYRLSRGVMRRPVPIATVSAALLILVGLPFLGVRFTGADATNLPKPREPRLVADALERDFATDRSSSLTLSASAPRGAREPLEDYAQRVEELSSVNDVSAPDHLNRDTWSIEVVPETDDAFDPRNLALVREVRTLDAPYPIAVAGRSAGLEDQQQSLVDRLPLALAIIGGTTVLILFLMTGSLILPLKSVLMNFLGLSATFGLLVLVFQDGRFEELLDYTSQGALESTQPVLLFVLAFALSTDYGVFLLTRIKEARDGGLANEEAVAVGLERTGRIVTAAAVLFSVALGAFATSEVVFIKLVGVGTVLAVLIDATLIRALLVPSLMRLLGGWNWWAPRPLRALHRKVGLVEE